MEQRDCTATRLLIADSTLRDEPQLAAKDVLLANRERSAIWRSAALPVADRVQLARELADLGVDLIEAGLAEAADELSLLREVSKEFHAGGPTISAVVRALGPAQTIAAAGAAISPAARPRLHLQTGADEMLNQRGGLRAPLDQLREEARVALDLALQVTPDVEFSPPRTVAAAVDIAAEWAQMAIEAGVSTINVRPTAEYTDPAGFRAYLDELMRLAPKSGSVTFSADVFVRHLREEEAQEAALACAEAAVARGCRQVKCAVHGTAATPGHVPLELLAFNLWARQHLGESDLHCGIDPAKLRATCDLVAAVKGYDVPASQPLVGAESKIARRVTPLVDARIG